MNETFVQLSRGPRTARVALSRVVSDPRENIFMRPGDVLTLCHGSDPAQAATLSVEARNGCAVALTLPAAGVAVYA